MFMVLVVVSLALTSCLFRRLGPYWALEIANYEEQQGGVPYAPPCSGVLGSTVQVASIGSFSAQATEEERSDFVEWRHEGSLRVGMPVTIEATCTDSSGAELGYARVEGKVATPSYDGEAGFTYVLPGVLPGLDERDSCLKLVDFRGRAPCIIDRLVVPN